MNSTVIRKLTGGRVGTGCQRRQSVRGSDDRARPLEEDEEAQGVEDGGL